ncbi:MAG: ribose 5-phosphate isomerase B [Flavobacteriaceae bacterium]|nr:ribose 5-phosphate isomerase B [Flavobacteriaceae bacterium]
MRISIGNDHAGVEYKNYIREYLLVKNIEVNNYGTDSLDSVDYPDFAHPVSKDVNEKKSDLGILICGSGNGVCMTANKYKNVRAALCWNKELAILSKSHNNANIICIPARFIQKEEALEIIKKFISEEFEGGRHERRVNKIST